MATQKAYDRMIDAPTVVAGLARVQEALKPKAAGIKKKGHLVASTNSKGKKLGKKDKILFHLGKRTAQKKKAKRTAKQ
eukprot:1008360-Prorocentrum_minimum.AAC.2